METGGYTKPLIIAQERSFVEHLGPTFILWDPKHYHEFKHRSKNVECKRSELITTISYQTVIMWISSWT